MATFVADETNHPRKARRRSSWLAALLSLLMPGLGHMYVGQARRGAVVFAFFVSLNGLLILCRFGVLPRFWMAAGILAALAALFLFAVIDSALAAHGMRNYATKSYNKWYLYAGAYLAGWIISTIPCFYVVQTQASGQMGYFKAPSASMEPLIRVGENFLADTAYYRGHEPSRGDVVVYMYPRDPTAHYFKRIVAVGGDQISLSEGHVLINGMSVTEPYANPGNPALPINNTPRYTVPSGHVFVLGDNRGNSTDSRSPAHGFIPVDKLLGRVTDIVYSPDLSRIGRWVGTPVTQ
jgi:signal peptidase I